VHGYAESTYVVMQKYAAMQKVYGYAESMQLCRKYVVRQKVCGYAESMLLCKKYAAMQKVCGYNVARQKEKEREMCAF